MKSVRNKYGGDRGRKCGDVKLFMDTNSKVSSMAVHSLNVICTNKINSNCLVSPDCLHTNSPQDPTPIVSTVRCQITIDYHSYLGPTEESRGMVKPEAA